MFEYLFTFQSLTAAQSARSVLNTEGIRAPVGRSARKLSAKWGRMEQAMLTSAPAVMGQDSTWLL